MAKVKRSNRFCLHNLLINNTTFRLFLCTFLLMVEKEMKNEFCGSLHAYMYYIRSHFFTAQILSVCKPRRNKGPEGVSMITIVSLTLVIVFFLILLLSEKICYFTFKPFFFFFSCSD